MLAKFADDMEIFMDWSDQAREFFVTIYGDPMGTWTRPEVIAFRDQLTQLIEETK